MGCPYSTSNATSANIEAIRTGDTFAFQRSPTRSFRLHSHSHCTHTKANKYVCTHNAREAHIHPSHPASSPHRHTHMQTPKRAAISVSFFPHPTTGRRTVVTILHVFFLLVCVLARCAATAFVRDRRRWATVSKMYAAYAVSIKSIACAYPHGCPRKSRATYKSQCQSRTRVSVCGGIYRRRSHAHACTPSIHPKHSTHPSVVRRARRARAHVRHTYTRTHKHESIDAPFM